KEQPVCAPDPAPYNPEADAPTELTASPAFQFLDELFSAGKITCIRVAELKEKYTQLHKNVISFQESEARLLQEAKQLSEELEKQQQQLEKEEQFPDESSSEVCQIRQQLLTCRNEYDGIVSREDEIQFRMECLQEEKRLLEKEYKNISRHKEPSKKIKQLKENHDDLCKEITQRKEEINAIKKDISAKQNMMLIDKKETEDLLEKQADLKNELVKILAIPVQLMKETKKLNREKSEEEKKQQALNDQIQELNGTLKDIDKRTKEILQESEDLMRELDGKQILLQSKEQEHLSLTKLLEINREKESSVLSDREALKEKLNKCSLEKTKQYEILIHKQAQKEKELKHLKTLELQQNVIYDSLEQDKKQHEKLKLEVEVLPGSNEVLLKTRQELQKEVELIKKNLAEQEMISNMDAHLLKEHIAEERQLFREQEKCRNELSRLAHVVSLKVEEREKKCRDVQKAQLQLQNIIKVIKRKDIEIKRSKKKKRDIQKQLQGFNKIDTAIQNERDKCINLVHAAQQKASEMKTRVKLVGNEVENLRNTVLTVERNLQQQCVKNTNNLAIADSLRNDFHKMVQSMLELSDKKKQQELNLERLTSMVTCIKEETLQLHKNWQRAVQQQKESDLLLREQEEELSFLREKMNMQERLCRDGEIEMQALDEKVRFLKMQVADKERQNKLLYKGIPVKTALDEQLVVLQIQHSRCKDRIKQMEEIFADATNESRTRELGGNDKDPTLPELLKQIEQLKVKLVQEEEKLLETDLLAKQVSRLTDRVRARVEGGQQDTLHLAQRVRRALQRQ
ncbi:CC146 protein, partial [Alcedo cyanopectus]|nr:CC146 protein [Ceyx cyanopectus]